MEKLSASRYLNMPSDLQHGWRLIINLWHISQRNENRPCKVKQGSSSCERQCGKHPETLLIERDGTFAGLFVTPTHWNPSQVRMCQYREQALSTNTAHFCVHYFFSFFFKAQYYTVTACFFSNVTKKVRKINNLISFLQIF